MGFTDLFFKKTENTAEEPIEAPVKEKASKKEVSEDTEPAVSSKDVDGVVEYLVEVLEKTASASEMFDYYKFHKAVKELQDSGQSEESAIANVFTTAKMMGVTKANILASAKEYIKLLETEKSDFETETVAQKKEGVDDKEKEAQELVTESDKMKRKAELLMRDAAKKKEDINRVTFAFGEAYNAIASKMQEEYKKISSYIKEGK